MSIKRPIKRKVVSELSGFVRESLSDAVDLNRRGIVASAGVVTRWNNSGAGGSGFDMSVVTGTSANLTEGTLNGVPCVTNAGGAGLETLGGQTVPFPMTQFLVGKADGLGVLQVFSSARSLDGSAPTLYIDGGDTITFNAGTSINSSVADTLPHLYSIRHNGDPTSNVHVTGRLPVTGNAGTESFEVGSLFSNPTDASLTLTGSIGRFILKPDKMNDLQFKQAQQQLKWKHAI